MKQLSTKSTQGNEEFLNEVTLISGVQHKNLVKLRGFCLKGHERLLVYEFLANRSLYQALFGTPICRGTTELVEEPGKMSSKYSHKIMEAYCHPLA